MRDKKTFILISILSLAIIIGFIFLAKSVFLAGLDSSSVWVPIGIVVSIGLLLFILKRLYLDMKNGVPFKDERSKRIKLYAAGYSYIVSIYVWLVLLIFPKHFDRDDIILIGMLGMVISFVISLFIIRKKRTLINEN